MKKAAGASPIFYILAAILFVVLVMAIPLPSYSTTTKSWFLDQSIYQRLTGSKSEGVPIYEVVNDITKSSITSPLELKCETDSDCKEYIVSNQCQNYCGNLDPNNTAAIAQLNNRRVCDPTQWSKPDIKCGCIAGKCIDL